MSRALDVLKRRVDADLGDFMNSGLVRRVGGVKEGLIMCPALTTAWLLFAW